MLFVHILSTTAVEHVYGIYDQLNQKGQNKQRERKHDYPVINTIFDSLILGGAGCSNWLAYEQIREDLETKNKRQQLNLSQKKKHHHYHNPQGKDDGPESSTEVDRRNTADDTHTHTNICCKGE